MCAGVGGTEGFHFPGAQDESFGKRQRKDLGCACHCLPHAATPSSILCLFLTWVLRGSTVQWQPISATARRSPRAWLSGRRLAEVVESHILILAKARLLLALLCLSYKPPPPCFTNTHRLSAPVATERQSLLWHLTPTAPPTPPAEVCTQELRAQGGPCRVLAAGASHWRTLWSGSC